jgi:hypothetical protein
MKRIYKIGIAITIIWLTMIYGYYTYPRKVDLTYSGIKYKLGNQQPQNSIEIKIDGFYYNKILSKDFFKGSIKIGNDSYVGLTLLVNSDMQWIKNLDNPKNTYGEIFIGKKINDLTICVQDGRNGWNSKNGIMISAPSKNRVEALKASNKLMKSVLRKKLQ